MWKTKEMWAGCGSSPELVFPACERKGRRKPNQALSASDRDTDLMTSWPVQRESQSQESWSPTLGGNGEALTPHRANQCLSAQEARVLGLHVGADPAGSASGCYQPAAHLEAEWQGLPQGERQAVHPTVSTANIECYLRYDIFSAMPVQAC